MYPGQAQYGQSEGDALLPWDSYKAIRTPPNYGAIGAAMAGVGVSVMYAIAMLPYCSMQRVTLLNYNLISGMLIDKLQIHASLWDIHMMPTCGNNGIIGVDQISTMLCQSTRGLWGHHLLLDMNSHACNLEESLRSSGAAQFLFRGAWGCDKFNLMSLGAMITLSCITVAMLAHITTALNVFAYYNGDTSARRRKWVLLFSAIAPLAAVTGGLAYLLLFDISHLIIPGTLRPPPGIIYPAGWGTLFLGTAVSLSVLVTLALLLFLDKLPSEEENRKFEQYAGYATVLQQEAMLQQQGAAIQQHQEAQQAAYPQFASQQAYPPQAYGAGGYVP